MTELRNTPAQPTLLTLAARKSFSFTVQFLDSNGDPLALTDAGVSFTIGEPISPPSEEELARDPHLTQRLRHEVEGALHELIEDELARRLGMAEQP